MKKCQLPCLTTAAYPPACGLLKPRLLLRTPEHSLSGPEACGGLNSPPRAAPKSRILLRAPLGRPVGAASFTEAMKMGSEVYHNLKDVIKKK